MPCSGSAGRARPCGLPRCTGAGWTGPPRPWRDPSIPAGDRLALTIDRATALLALGEEAGWTAAARLPEDAATAQEAYPIAAGCVNTGDDAMRWGRYDEARRRLTAGLRLATDTTTCGCVTAPW